MDSCESSSITGAAMSLSVAAEPVPLRVDAGGTYRIGATRVTLDTVVWAYNNGDSAERIVLQYPVLRLPDVYAVILYYLRHQAEVDAYLAEAEREADALQQRLEAESNPTGLRAKLLARRNAPG